MAFHYLTNLPLDQAVKEYFAALDQNGFGPQSETIPVSEANGRITAEAVYAHISAPHYLASAMDGIALSSAVTFGATETTPITLKADDFTVVDTGDPIPEGCDAVMMIEDVIMQKDGTAKLYSPAVPWQHIRQIGEDICAGEMILSAHMKITPAAIGAMLAAGVMKVNVLKKPVIGIIPTGDEIVLPSEDPKPGDIIEFNSSIFAAMLKEWGAEVNTYPIIPDDPELLFKALTDALQGCDAVLINAGSSAGREDYTSEVNAKAGRVVCHGIAIKPGKPAILGYSENKAVLGIPGYPVSGILVLSEIVKPLLGRWFEDEQTEYEEVNAKLVRQVVSGLKYQEYIRVRLGKVDGKLVASPLSRGSGVVSSFMKADGLLIVPQGVEGYEAGTEVKVRLLKNAETLDRTLVAIGSHDPLLDECADLIHINDPAMYMSSSHVGSMGGIMAVRRGEAHAAGVHLLNEKDGTYNTAFIRKYFPNGGVSLVECVGRTQGIMLAKGNPLQITGIEDLTRAGLRYVNRQKGSGTRILIDYLCKTHGVDSSAIIGYDREEFTHTSVAAQIAAGTADAGMGIYSAAKLYDLDFLPVCTEQYDLLIPDYAMDTPMVQKLLEVLRSDAFRKRIENLGGYTLENPGTVREHF